jgi:PAS domain S-box-containing protein
MKNFISKYTPSLLILWTLIIAISIAWNIQRGHLHTLEKARIEARTLFEVNLVYRRWFALHGGVYAPVTGTFRPNPYLTAPRRDIKTTDGASLTLVNPAWMTRMVFEMLQEQSPLSPRNRITSLKYTNPINKPDEWERNALLSFEKGQKEVSEITAIDGRPYMRLMKPMYADKGCLNCHGHQGYKEGELRGGIGIAVPMSPYYAAEAKAGNDMLFAHLALWLSGIWGIVFFTRKIQSKQDEIAEKEWKFRTLSEFAHDWEYWINEKMEIVFISPSCERITGYAEDEFMERPELLWDVIYPDDRILYKGHMSDFRQPYHEAIEFRIICKGGQMRWISHTCGPIYKDGSFLGRRVSNRDITERKKLEEQVFQSQKMESLGLMAGGIAHDFNNILTAIMGYASLLRQAGLDEKAKSYVTNILNSSERAQRLTSSLLAFSRKQIIKASAISLNSALENISGILNRLISEDIELRLKPSEEDLPVFADPHQIEQAIMNLAANARDAMPRGGVLSIEITATTVADEYARSYNVKPGRYMLTVVSDTGIGIAKEDLPHIFEPFYTTKEMGKGTGLGLSMVYGILKQHGGFINVYSEKNAGTTFKAYLPVSPASEDQPHETRREAAPMPTEDFKGSETILIADDDETIRKFLKDTLESYGYKTIHAVDGEDAIKKYDEHKEEIALALLDVVMPKKNAVEIFNHIKEADPDAKALLMSGYTHDIITSKGIYEMGLEFIEKPIVIEALLKKIRETIGRG